MLTTDLLNKNEIRNFVYDTSQNKILIGSIGSRCIGKTSALLLELAKNSSNPDMPRNATVITNVSGQHRSMYETLVCICNELGIRISTLTPTGVSCEAMTEIENSKIKFITSNAFLKQRSSSYKYKDNYIDEPNYMIGFSSIMKEARYRTMWAKDAKTIIAGSSTVGKNHLKDLSADINYSRHYIWAKDYLSNMELE